MTKRKNETREEYLERCRAWEKEHRPNRWKERREYIKNYLKSYKQHQRYCCESLENVENYEKAKADNFEGWHLHHRLETHTSDGEKRLVDISMKELKALGMYYHRPANELLFIKDTEHIKIHNTGKKGHSMSEEGKQRVRKINSERLSKKVRCVETGEIFESAKKASEITSIKNICNAARGARKTAGGYHWEYL